MTLHIRFIGFGEAGRSFAESLGAFSELGLSAYDILFDSEGLAGKTAQAAREREVQVSAQPRDGLESADWIILAVTASSSLEAARSIAGGLGARHTVIDINSVSPSRKREAAALVEAQGARYVDMAVMAPVKPRNHRTPVLIAGDLAPAFTDRLATLEFAWEQVGDAPGEATAIKMVRSVFVKGLEALTAQTLLAAQRSGCYERILASLSASYPGLSWPDFPHYQIERMLTHGARRAAEMRESARTMDELGFEGELVRQIANLHDALGALDVSASVPLAEMVAAVEKDFVPAPRTPAGTKR